MKDVKKEKFFKNIKLILVGLVAGFINGFFGAGGGLLLVPMIHYFCKQNSKIAHATTLVCVLFMCVTSSVIYIIKKQVNYSIFLSCSIGGVIGSLIGTKLLKKLKNNVIDVLFSFVLMGAGLLMIFL